VQKALIKSVRSDVLIVAALHLLLVVAYLLAVTTGRDLWFMIAGVLLLVDLFTCIHYRPGSKFARVSSTICLGLIVWVVAFYFVWRGFRDGSR
jgi:hypothetical protein